MSLIKCPECGKEISDKIDVCIHCGYPLKKEKIYKRNFFQKNLFKFLIPIIIMIIIVVCVFSWDKNMYTVYNKELITIMECSKSSIIKDILGEGYSHKSYSSSDETSDDYEDVYIGNLKCSLVQLSYDSVGRYERVYIEVTDVEKKDKKRILKDLMAQYGREYEYEKDEIELYCWEIGVNRRVLTTILSEDDRTYRIVINSYHQLM